MIAQELLTLSIFLIAAGGCLIWHGSHSSRRGMFLVRKRRGNRNILYMRPSQCPVGDMAAAKIFISLRKLLRQLRAEGYGLIFFESHMVRKDNFEQFLKFLEAEDMICEQINFRKTLPIHSAHLKLTMLISHKKRINVHTESARICIRLQ
ncbi:hypothetical protein [Pantoea agglomerans]|uniref:hypothetical protein n=1 Tax=Enterobacter agglomerans TaxID=549 RepID=UPI003159B1B9